MNFINFVHRDSDLPEAAQLYRRRYLALVLLPNQQVFAVDLGFAVPLDTAIHRLHRALAERDPAAELTARELYQRLMQPILTRIPAVRQLLIVPDGELHLVPFDVLHDGQKYLADRVQITYLTSGRDLLTPLAERQPATDVVVFADPDFTSATPWQEPHQPSPLVAQLMQSRESTRGLRGDRLVLTGLERLPGARQEAEDLSVLMPNAHLLLGEEATELALLGLQSPGILHIATHGLFVGESGDGGRGRGFEETTEPAQSPTETDGIKSLLRSVLVLAGAGTYKPSIGPLAQESQDGLVTALELAGMDLWGTQLVVLSACNSGRGYIRPGEGVYGLRRALISAGAETVVNSLWKIDDAVTRQLMKEFYGLLLSGVGRADAMRQAAIRLRNDPEHREYAHPYYWAAFLVTGEGGPLRGRLHSEAVDRSGALQ